MNLDYQGPTKINLNRICPKFPNSCRQSVIANAINFLSKKQLFTPESILVDINHQRKHEGKNEFDGHLEALADEEVDSFVSRSTPELSVIRVNGQQYLNTDLWKKLIEKQFILVVNHQLFYSDPLDLLLNEINYLPPDLVRRLVKEPDFSYQTFINLYKFYLDRAKGINEGHVDIVLDLKEIDGVESVILANLASVGNEFLINLPFNFYKNYLAFDWVNEKTITQVEQLPTEEEFQTLRHIGFLDNKAFQFVYGQIEIYYPIARRSELDQILL